MRVPSALIRKRPVMRTYMDQKEFEEWVDNSCLAESPFGAPIHLCGESKDHVGRHRCAAPKCKAVWRNDAASFDKWWFNLREGIFGHVTSPPRSRWIVWDHPFSPDVRDYGAPQRFNYYGKKWCWSFGAKKQIYDWDNDRFADWQNEKNWKRFVVWPADYRERFERQYK